MSGNPYYGMPRREFWRTAGAAGRTLMLESCACPIIESTCTATGSRATRKARGWLSHPFSSLVLPALVVVLVLTLNAALGTGPAAQAGLLNSSYYVDCQAPTAGNGTEQQPWSNLAHANAVVLQPGASLLLKRGSVCTGMLKPQGNGARSSPIIIGAYGTGNLPQINAQGLAAALQLADMSYVIAQDLELTDTGDPTTVHHGVHVTASTGVVREVALRRLFVHDVNGPVAFTDTDKHGGGIIVENLNSAGPGRFDGVTIENNHVESVARSGIWIAGNPSTPRPRATEPWPEASTGIVVRQNYLTGLAGDGIVPTGTVGALVEGNVVSDGNLSGKNFFSAKRNCSVGIWTYQANRTLIQYNEVFRYRFGTNALLGCDGTGFDVDNHQDGTIIQFNYSHDNAGGFTLLCSDDQPRTADVRYNLSVNDAHVFSASPCKFPTLGNFAGVRLFNNTIVANSPDTTLESVPLPILYSPSNFLFANNIIYARQLQLRPLACGNHCTKNLFFKALPSGIRWVYGDPLFENANLTGTGFAVAQAYRLQVGSPATGAGVQVPGGPGKDFFGNPVPATGTPTIGFFEPQS